MPTRAALTTIDPLAAAHRTLPGRPKPVAGKFPPQGSALDVETRALAMPSSREIMGSISTRVPVSMIQELNDVCAARGIDQSPLVRHFIAAGLRSLPPFDGKSSK